MAQLKKDTQISIICGKAQLAFAPISIIKLINALCWGKKPHKYYKRWTVNCPFSILALFALLR